MDLVGDRKGCLSWVCGGHGIASWGSGGKKELWQSWPTLFLGPKVIIAYKWFLIWGKKSLPFWRSAQRPQTFFFPDKCTLVSPKIW